MSLWTTTPLIEATPMRMLRALRVGVLHLVRKHNAHSHACRRALIGCIFLGGGRRVGLSDSEQRRCSWELLKRKHLAIPAARPGSGEAGVSPRGPHFPAHFPHFPGHFLTFLLTFVPAVTRNFHCPPSGICAPGMWARLGVICS